MSRIFQRKSKRGRPKIEPELEHCSRNCVKLQVYISELFHETLKTRLGEKCLSRKIREILITYVSFLVDKDEDQIEMWNKLHQKLSTDEICDIKGDKRDYIEFEDTCEDEDYDEDECEED